MRRLSLLLVAAALLAASAALQDPWGGGYEGAGDVVIWYSNPSPMEIAEAAPGLVLVDPDGLSPYWVERLGAGGSVVLAYVNLGMAEEWRGYWRGEWLRDPPPWLGPESPEWEREFLVRFWRPEWLGIVRGLVEEAVEKGFEGVVFDNLDVCEYWGECGRLPEVLEGLREGLELRVYVNVGAAWRMLYDPVFLEAVDGVVIEEVLARGWEGPIPALQHARRQGKDVVLLEYASRRERVEEALEAGRALGFRVFVGDRGLDGMPGYLPLYHGVQLIEGRLLYSYRRPWDRFRVYLEGVEVGVGRRAVGAVSGGRLAVAYEGGDGYVYLLLEGERVYRSWKGCGSPSLAPYGEGFALVFLCEAGGRRDLHLLTLDGRGVVTLERRLTEDEAHERYPLAASNGDGLAVLFEREGELVMIGPEGFKAFGEVEPYSYAIAPYEDGFAVVYSDGSKGVAVFPDAVVEGVPEPLWESNALVLAGMLHYISQDGWIIRVCPNGSWWPVEYVGRVYPAGMWLAKTSGGLTAYGPDKIP